MFKNNLILLLIVIYHFQLNLKANKLCEVDYLSNLYNNQSLNLTQNNGNGKYDIDRFIIPSLFPNVPPSIRFSTCETNTAWKLPNTLTQYLHLGQIKGQNPDQTWLYHFILNHTGFFPSMPRQGQPNVPFAFWSTKAISSARQLKFKTSKTHSKPILTESYQKYNHLPGMSQLGHKDNQCLNIKAAMSKFSKKERREGFGFVLPCYALPLQAEEFKTEWMKREFKKSRGSSANNTIHKKLHELWIIKPSKTSKGRGISLINHYSQLKELNSSSTAVAQKLVTNPYLLDGKKIEIKTFVLITSTNPLRVYLTYDSFTHGSLKNFTAKYSSVSDPCNHVINSRICWNHLNESHEIIFYSPCFFASEFTPSQLAHIKSQIEDAVVKSLLSVQSKLNTASRQVLFNRYNAFHLVSFDFFLTNKLHVWLNEVNTGPNIKRRFLAPMLAEAFTIAGYNLPPFLLEAAKKLVKAHVSLINEDDDVEHVVINEQLYSFHIDKEQRKVRQAKINQMLDVLNNSSSASDFAWSQLQQQRLEHIILNELNPDDMRTLILASDELHRVSGKFKRILPSVDGYKNSLTMKLIFEGLKPDEIYYHMLAASWEFKYRTNEEKYHEGIKRLKRLAEKKVHLS